MSSPPRDDPARPPAAPAGEDTAALPPDPGGPTLSSPTPDATDAQLTAMLLPPLGPDEVGRLGGYRVLRLLGRGGMGAVFEAEDLKLGRRAALKVMLPTLAATSGARERFLREARAVAAVEHDHIVPIYQVGEDNGVPFLAMPLLRGETLDDRLRRDGTVPIPELVVVGRQIADGLSAAHRAGLVHRDVKPSNVWLERTEDGGFRRARLLDFGLARPRQDDTALTGSGAVLGTPAYMAPEQARGEHVDHRADLFSLGCVLYHAATGQRPFKGKDTFAVLTSLAVDTPAPPIALNPAVPPALSGLILRLLSKDPAGRPQTAKDVAGELVQVGTALAFAGPSAPVLLAEPVPDAASEWSALAGSRTEIAPPAPSATRPRRRAVWLAAGVALLVLLGLAAIFSPTLARLVGNKGALVVEADAPHIEVIVKHGDTLVVNRATGRRFEVPAGDVEVEFFDPTTGVRSATRRVRVGRARTQVVRVSASELTVRHPVVVQPKPKKVDPKIAEVPDAGRKALRSVLAAGGKVGLSAGGRRWDVLPGQSLPPGPFEVEAIDFRGLKGFDGTAADGWRDLPPVKWLHLQDTGVTDAGLAALARCPNLTSCAHLDLGSAPVTDNGLAALAGFRSLSSLTLQECPIRGPGVAHLAGLPIRHLNLVGTPVTGQSLVHLKGMPLTGLYLTGCANVDDAGVAHLAGVRTLALLSLSQTAVTDVGVKHLRGLSHLEFLSLSGDGITDAALDEVSGMRGLEIVELVTPKVTADGLRKLRALPGLTGLNLNHSGATDDVVAAVKDLPYLDAVYLPETRVTDAAIEHLAACPNLLEVHVAKTRVTPDGVAKLVAALPHSLVHSDVGDFPPKSPVPKARPVIAALLEAGVRLNTQGGNVTAADAMRDDERIAQVQLVATPERNPVADPAVLAALRGLPPAAWWPRVVVYVSGPVTGEQLKALADALPTARVRFLSLAKTRLSDDALAAVGRLTALDSVQLNNNPSLTDAAAAHLAGLPRLRQVTLTASRFTARAPAGLRAVPLDYLSLADNPGVDDAAVEPLSALRTLSRLDLKNTKVSAAGVKKLNAALPHCTIEWDGGTVEPKR